MQSKNFIPACHSGTRYAYLVINNSKNKATTVEIPAKAVCYTLAGANGMRSTVKTLNGRELVLGDNDELPDLSGEVISEKLELAPGSRAFIII